MGKYQYIFSEDSLHYRKSLEGDGYNAFSRFKCIPTKCLEIGIFEGASATWFLENILTHPDSTYLGIDDNLRPIALTNLEQHKERVTTIHGDSNQILPKLVSDGKKFDMIYIDGCHKVVNTLIDLKYALLLLNPNGVILIDDYEHPEYRLKEPIQDFLKDKKDIITLFQTYKLCLQYRSKEPNENNRGHTGEDYTRTLQTPEGHIDYRFAPGNTVEIVDLLVYADKRQGIGKGLIKQLLSDLQVRKCSTVYAMTRGNNEIAQEFYAAMGFKLLATLPWFYDGTGLEKFALIYGYHYDIRNEQVNNG